MSESDLADCLVFINNLKLIKDKLNRSLIIQAVKDELTKAMPEKVKRLQKLLSEIP